mmetsp:Transcript_15116/g.19821  ORF Transcript_15116/g.19821 Transcript_15116/m.19821 type:complete len:328 (-) Transcript_15116:645-1628(-)
MSNLNSVFPDSLPGIPGKAAFGVIRTQLDKVLTVDYGGCWRFSNTTNDVSIRGLVETLELEFPLMGQASNLNQLTLDEEAKRSANIPATARWFCFGYPIEIRNQDRIENIDLSNPNIGFLLYGGFMYFDHETEGQTPHLVQVNSLVPSNDGLFFGPPKRFKGSEDRRFQNELAGAGRFHEITIQSLREKGARYFCWVNPGEHNNFCPDGGFLYLFSDNFYFHSKHDRYFQVLNEENYFSTWNAVTQLTREESADGGLYFGYVGMRIEQLRTSRAYVEPRIEQLDNLLNERDKQEQEMTKQLEGMSKMDCIRKLTEAGASQKWIRLFF